MRSSFFSSRKGMELAISTMVVMILGILIIGGGIVLVAKVSGGGIEVVSQVSREHKAALDQMLTAGQLVAATPSNQQVVAGKSVQYGIGIKNIEQSQTFDIAVASDVTLGSADDEWRMSHLPNIEVKRDEQGTAPIIVTPGKEVQPGIYTFIVNITRNGETYDSARFFTVSVR